jgi:hypothetical protein
MPAQEETGNHLHDEPDKWRGSTIALCTLTMPVTKDEVAEIYEPH